eukprot:TRINITY_DN257_c0_g1_i1.p1 TRINITY_DN257_c0_g1~~TRINITY_DN257_c0_g1_i1.p1  ORF type:complete len:305 (-),score=55.29 TRINITY_DN257_c0_g1_i1:277-1191(-)
MSALASLSSGPVLRPSTFPHSSDSWFSESCSSALFYRCLPSPPCFRTRMEPSGRRRNDPLSSTKGRKFSAVSNTGGDGGGDWAGGKGGGDGGGGDEEKGKDQPGWRNHSNYFGWLVAWYMTFLERHPLATKALTAGLLNLLADLFCQVVVERVHLLDGRRLLSFAAIGCLIVGPVLHYWYGILSSIIRVEGRAGVVLRLFVDQFIFSPLSVVTFIGLLLVMEGRPHDVIPKLQRDLLPTVVNMWKLWVPFQLLNFSVVPQNLQVGAANLIGLIWTVFMSYASHHDISDGHPKQKQQQSVTVLSK